MNVLVCGGRGFKDAALLNETLFAVKINASTHGYGPLHIIQGGARGADELALRWAAAQGVEWTTFHAEWSLRGRAAGPIRNKRMLEVGRPDLVVAFKGGSGTAHMVRIAEKAGVTVRRIGW